MTRLFIKGKALNVGATTTWTDGSVHKKVSPGKWILVRQGDGVSTRVKADRKAGNYYSEATSMSWAGLGIVEHLEGKYKVIDFASLKKLISEGPRDQASKVFRSIKTYVDSLSIPTGNKAAAVDRIGRSLIILKEAYARAKQKLTIKMRSKESGKIRYESKKAPQASFSAGRIKTAKSKLGGWSDMGKMPTMKQLKIMIKNKTARITWGVLQGKRKWEVYQKSTDTTIPFKENAKGIVVKMRQFEIHKQRTRRTVVVKLTIPYPYTRQFIESHIKSARTRNILIGELMRSAGYKKAVA